MNPEQICFGCFREKASQFGPCPHCGFDAAEGQPFLALPLGTILNGRYLTGRVLGIGGFGITYLGFDLTLEIKVAIKEYMPSGMATRHSDGYNVALTGHMEREYRAGEERFLDEARILAKLQDNPHIVSVQNYFKENNTAYFVMEYIEGMSLKEYLADQGGKLPYDQALAILLPVMEALTQVHALNLMHRDISPDNIYITAAGESRLLDFGAARFSMGDNKSVSVILKHGYAPEEQYSSHGNQGPWTDVYAMGATMYSCITGVLPPDAIERIHLDQIQKPSELGVVLPAHAETAIMKALAVKAEDRFSNMGAFIQALRQTEAIRDRVATSVTRKAATLTAYTEQQVKKPSVFARFAQAFKTSAMVRGIAIGCAALVVALAVVLPIVLSGGGKDTPDPGTSPGGAPAPVETISPIRSIDPAPSPSADPAPSQSTDVETQEKTLDALNATIEVPTTYAASSNGLTFTNEAQNRQVTTGYIWNYGFPVYSLQDIKDNAATLVEHHLKQIGEYESHEILNEGDVVISEEESYAIIFDATDSDKKVTRFAMAAITGKNGFGCYLLVGRYLPEDEEGMKEIGQIIDTFHSAGAVKTTYDIFEDKELGFHFIYDTSLVKGGTKTQYASEVENGVGCVFLYPSSNDEMNVVEVDAPLANIKTTADALALYADIMKQRGVTGGEEYTVDTTGGIVWHAQDYTITQDGVTYINCFLAAEIDGTCFPMGVFADKDHEDVAKSLLNQVTNSLRPVS